jgi:hypothetical protein
MAKARTCEVGPTLAPLNIGFSNVASYSVIKKCASFVEVSFVDDKET